MAPDTHGQTEVDGRGSENSTTRCMKTPGSDVVTVSSSTPDSEMRSEECPSSERHWPTQLPLDEKMGLNY